MEGNLSYQAACIIYETSNNLMNQLIPLYEKETKEATKKEYQLLYNYFMMPITWVQLEIKEEMAFIPPFVREFIPKMNIFKDKIKELMAELNSLYSDGLKLHCCEQYLAKINAIEAKKNEHYSEFQQLMASTKTLSGVQDQKVIAYESKLSGVETTTQGASHVKPVLLQFSEWENIWAPFLTVFEAKKEEVKQLQENNAYLSQAYGKVVAQNFDIAQSLLTEEIPLENLEKDISQLNKRLLDCESDLETIIDRMKLTCCVGTNQEFQLDTEKRKLIEQISSSAKMLYLPQLSMTCTLSDIGLLSAQVDKKLADLASSSKKQSMSLPQQNSRSSITALYNQVKSANTFQEFEKITDALVQEVQESMGPLSGGSLASCMENLKDGLDIKKNKQEAMTLLSGFSPAISSGEVVSSNTMDEKKICNVLQELISKLEAVLMQQPIYQKLSEERAIARNEVTLLKNADELVKNLCEINAAIQTHEYDEQTVNALKKAAFLNPSGIFKEDKFYEDIKFIIANFEAELKKLNDASIKKDNLSSLENAFNKALNQKIEEAKAALIQSQTNYERLKKDWESLAVQYPIIKNSRALSKAPKNVAQTLTNCEGQDLRRIQLKDKNFQGVALRYANLSESHLQRCDFSGCDLQSVNFKGATLEQCTFINFKDGKIDLLTSSNFKGVILDKKTELDWENNSGKILLDNLSDPLFKPTQTDYFQDLIATVKSKTPIQGEWVLDILKAIGGWDPSFRRWTHPSVNINKMNLITQQNHAVFVIKQLIPEMDSIQEVLALRDLVDKKDHIKELFETQYEATKRNPYAFIRRELDIVRFKYGNTQPWKEIIQTIQTRLNELAVKAASDGVILTSAEYKAGERIMKTHVEHDYGSGFFYTPAVSSQWEALNPNRIPTIQLTC